MPSPLPVDSTLPTTQPIERWKTGNLLAIVSLVLSAIGAIAIIELRPQIEVLPMAETENSQPFSAPFRIHNAGYLSFDLKRVICFESKIEGFQGNVTGTMIVKDFPTGTEVEKGHNETVKCGIAHITPPITGADLTIAVDYSQWPIPHTWRKHYRFTGDYVDNWQWLEVSPAQTQKEVDDRIRRSDELLKSFEHEQKPNMR